MNLIYINRQRQSCRVGLWGTLALVLVVSGVMGYSGYRTGLSQQQNQLAEKSVELRSDEQQIPMDEYLHAAIASQRHDIDTIRKKAESELNELALRLGKLQARMNRLDAMGSQLVDKGELDAAEFDFSSEPGIGGPVSSAHLAQINNVSNVKDQILEQLDQLSDKIRDREQKLLMLNNLVLQQSIDEEVIPLGRPIIKGWISSRYGTRNDPFTGKPDFHKGIDLAGKDGSPVIAVATGVVMWSDKRYGYGDMVEINHGNGFITRYGHNKELLVDVGDKVERGDTIALMGSSGRSTGPHVHFEVIRNGKAIDPMRFVNMAKK